MESLTAGLADIINYSPCLDIKQERHALFKYISAIFVIGSLASGECTEDSDIDIVIILNKEEIMYDYGLRDLTYDLHMKYEKRLQIIPISISNLIDYHMFYKTTMYHSILRGIELYNDGTVLVEKVCSAPTLEWLIEWYLNFSRIYKYGLDELNEVEELQMCKITDEHLARSFFNFCIIYIELVHGVVPTTKKQVLYCIEKYRPDLKKYLRLAINIRKKRVPSTLKMAKLLLKANIKIKRDILKVYRIIRRGEIGWNTSSLKFLQEYY